MQLVFPWGWRNAAADVWFNMNYIALVNKIYIYIHLFIVATLWAFHGIWTGYIYIYIYIYKHYSPFRWSFLESFGIQLTTRATRPGVMIRFPKAGVNPREIPKRHERFWIAARKTTLWIDYTLWWTNIAMERSTIFHGKIHYFYGHFPLLFVCSPEGKLDHQWSLIMDEEHDHGIMDFWDVMGCHYYHVLQ